MGCGRGRPPVPCLPPDTQFRFISEAGIQDQCWPHRSHQGGKRCTGGRSSSPWDWGWRVGWERGGRRWHRMMRRSTSTCPVCRPPATPRRRHRCTTTSARSTPVHDQESGRPAVLRPGPPAHLGLQPRRGDRLLHRGDSERLHLRHVLVGDRLRPRSEHQRADGHRGREAGVGSAAERAEVRRQGDAPRAGLHRRARQALLVRSRGRRVRRSTRPSARRWARWRRSIPATPRRRRIYADAHEPVALELLHRPGRQAAPADGGAGFHARAHHQADIRIIPARATCTSTRWRPRPRPPARCPAPTGWPS